MRVLNPNLDTNMNNQLIPLQFHTHPVRILPHEDGSSFWIVAQDVTDILGYTTAKDGLRRIPDKHKGRRSVPTPGGKQDMLCVDEPGLYRLVLRSDKPEAEPFMEWVTNEVLPAIRKTGAYVKDAKRPEPSPAPVVIAPSKIEMDPKEVVELYKIKAAYWEQQANRKATRRNLEQQEKDRILHLHRAGLKPSQIAKEIERSKETIESYLRSTRVKGGAQ